MEVPIASLACLVSCKTDHYWSWVTCTTSAWLNDRITLSGNPALAAQALPSRHSHGLEQQHCLACAKSIKQTKLIQQTVSAACIFKQNNRLCQRASSNYTATLVIPQCFLPCAALRDTIRQYYIVVKNNEALGGLPADNNWVLRGVQNDTLGLHEFLAMNLSRALGWWAPRTQYTEVQ